MTQQMISEPDSKCSYVYAQDESREKSEKNRMTVGSLFEEESQDPTDI